MTSDAAFITEIDYAFGGVHAPDKIGVAVSGGSDSLALLYLLHDWGKAALTVATVDHGLRPEAADEADGVARHCADLGVPHRVLKWQGWDGKGNLQDQARQTRFSLLADWAKATGCDTVALGHTMDDQAETFLMRLSRASGIEGLIGMDRRIWRQDQRFDRPLLTLRRGDLQGYLTGKGIAWADDPSNDDLRFDRVKARKALGHLEALGLDPKHITQSMTNLALAGIELRQRAHDLAEKLCKETAGDVIFDRAGFRRLSPEMQHRLLSKALMFVSSEPYPPRRDAMADAEDAVIQGRNHTLHGCLILVSDMTFRITREWNAVETQTGPTDQPWDTRWHLDGPHDETLEIHALGDAIKDTPWRDTGLPRQSLLASPAVWKSETLVAAPVAGLANDWTAQATGRGKFTDFLLRR